jgi:hypothetical protein
VILKMIWPVAKRGRPESGTSRILSILAQAIEAGLIRRDAVKARSGGRLVKDRGICRSNCAPSVTLSDEFWRCVDSAPQGWRKRIHRARRRGTKANMSCAFHAVTWLG